MSEWDTTALLSDIRERGSLPDNDLRFTDALLLSAATKELREGVAPMLANARAEHLVYPYSQAVTSGQNSYRMPPRAIGGVLRDVAFLDSGGRPTRLRQLSADEIEEVGRLDNTGTPYAYWLQSYKVILVGVPNIPGTLSTPYYARPNTLVLPSAVVASTSVSQPATGVWELTFVGTPPVGLGTPGTVSVDIVRATPGFETLIEATDCVITELSPSQFTYTISSTATDIAAGDYVCVAGQAPVPQVPVEMFGLLAARAARRAIKSVGDDRWQSLEADVLELEQKAKDWLAPRVSGDTQQAGGSIGNNGLVGGIGWAFGWY